MYLARFDLRAARQQAPPLATYGGKLVLSGGKLGTVSSGGASNPDNAVVITEASSTTQTAPITFLGQFAQGEIANYVQVLVEGSPAGQAYVTARYGDGSVQHAAVAVPLALTSGQSKTITFQNTGSAPSTTPETKANMLANYDFDSVISLTQGGTTYTASARDMLTADDYEVVLSGPDYTAIYLHDHTGASYDIGWSGRHPHRPCFYAEFWPALAKCRVRAIIETAKTTEVEDSASVDVLITAGYASPTTVLSETGLTLKFGERPSRVAWTGGAAPGHVNIDIGLAYRASIGALPNYDTTLGAIDESVISTYYTAYSGWLKDLFRKSSSNENQGWHQPMEDQGGNSNLGPYPTWHSTLLFSGDWRMLEICQYLDTNLSSICAFHYRESASKTFHGSTSGLGKPISIVGRPTIGLRYGNNMSAAQTAVGDRLTYYGGYATNGAEMNGHATYEAEHIPNNWPITYTYTADPFLLEEMMFAGTYDIAFDGSGYRYTGPYGGFTWGDPRRWATLGMQRLNAAYFAKSGTIEKTYLEEKLNEMIAVVDGMLGFTTESPHNGETMHGWGVYLQTNVVGGGYIYGLTYGGEAAAPYRSPIGYLYRFWNAMGWIDYAKAKGSEAPWMSCKIAFMAQRCTELGYDWSTLTKHIAKMAQGVVTDYPEPTHCRFVEMPTTDTSNYFLTTWAAVWDAMLEHDPFTGEDLDDRINFQHGYMLHMMMAAMFDPTGANYAAAKTWYDANVRAYAVAAGWKNNPKWAILPRV